MSDVVKNPSHYCEGRQYEPRKVIRDWGLNFNLGNAVKYLSRAGRKDKTKTIEDLEKAKQYIDFEIEGLKEDGFDCINDTRQELIKNIQIAWGVDEDKAFDIYTKAYEHMAKIKRGVND